MAGKLLIIGFGPGSFEHITKRAREAIEESEVIIGYNTYVDLIRGLLTDQEIVRTGMTEEVSRAQEAVRQAEAGKKVAVISSGDAGVYGMAGLVYEVLMEKGWSRSGGVEVEIIPGISAINSSASLLGAPVMHDACTISLSDHLTPWELIARRVEAAAQADFVIALYNPRSGRRTRQIVETQRILLKYRSPETPVGIVKSAYRDRQHVVLTNLRDMLDHDIGMLTTVIIGNASTTVYDGLMITPRGYQRKYTLNADVQPLKPHQRLKEEAEPWALRQWDEPSGSDSDDEDWDWDEPGESDWDEEDAGVGASAAATAVSAERASERPGGGSVSVAEASAGAAVSAERAGERPGGGSVSVAEASAGGAVTAVSAGRAGERPGGGSVSVAEASAGGAATAVSAERAGERPGGGSVSVAEASAGAAATAVSAERASERPGGGSVSVAEASAGGAATAVRPERAGERPGGGSVSVAEASAGAAATAVSAGRASERLGGGSVSVAEASPLQLALQALQLVDRSRGIETAADGLPAGAGMFRQQSIFELAVSPGVAEKRFTAKQMITLADVVGEKGSMEYTPHHQLIVRVPTDNPDEITSRLRAEGFLLAPIGDVAQLKACDFCNGDKGDAIPYAEELQRKLGGLNVPKELRIGLNGCGMACYGAVQEDIGIVYRKQKFDLFLGGKTVGRNAHPGQPVAEGIEPEQLVETIERIVQRYISEGHPNERFHKFFKRVKELEGYRHQELPVFQIENAVCGD
ncbi:Cobalt-precorrin-3B C(17)-methyltransferase [Paenibacillus konkukensis]|uniref:Cobalt-precorrin-3B C(17)-methyltransferase n=1 Tax=Paenibacillus konkukensis TaxID=2020716 RepID=A0ABY4RVS4_9BACL|nr:precorrin-3B C(17)-methyltransferase [Paenibacillus konkukensis]UQZ85781.1 Cobalt-precorrin-3B C(17)-methyltransferase [Paenibacillus konkukensis]